MLREKFIQTRRHQTPGYFRWHIHSQAPAQCAGILAEQVLQLVHLCQHFTGAFVQRLAVLSRTHPSGGAVQQTGIDQAFQVTHLLRHRRARQAQTFGGLGKTAQFGDTLKGTQQLQLVHDGGPDCSLVAISISGFSGFISICSINNL